MPATDRIHTRRHRATAVLAGLALATAGVAGVAGAATPAAGTGAQHSAASAAGASSGSASNLAQFAVDSPAMIQAELIAVKYWNTSPCGGNVNISWGQMDPSVNAASTWWNPVAAYGNASANSQCNITLNQAQDFDWPMFCTVMVHEIGHLVGQQHSTDSASVMYPVYVAPIPQCTGAAPAAGGQPAATPAATIATSPATAHKAHSRHKSHKKTTKKAKKHA